MPEGPVSLRVARGSRSALPRSAFLPTTRAEMDARGWDQLDVLIVTGDAYVDHPAFGPILVARFLEGRGYRVGVVAQPDWRNTEALLGRTDCGSGAGVVHCDRHLLTSTRIL